VYFEFAAHESWENVLVGQAFFAAAENAGHCQSP
jgi:hypothetical protein